MASHISQIHRQAVALFLQLGLSYKFTCTLVNKDEHKPTMRFLFSKPTHHNPIPAITVHADVQFQSKNEDGSITYSVLMEGGQYTRTVVFTPGHICGDEFNESWIDCVSHQKAVVKSLFAKQKQET
eukprot:NODE_6800_length_620_cov_150.784990_g6777_i0.p1 GENE.NODE_6800_length_620_cov_150.784990_g6777_i0~~NODE_6800_length_620_cov_150.784990_g6777_i0.p1  ORF type:complete len:126 (+),score=13.83 NODE_6800_length_620_cov_150.784990_g6777_i0:120-497(+)